MEKKYARVVAQLNDLYKLRHVSALLAWDEQVNMPPRAAEARGEANAYIATLAHKLATDPEYLATVDELSTQSAQRQLDDDQRVIIREVKRDLDHARKLPPDFVAEFSKTTSLAFAAWGEARGKAEFSIFEPQLHKVIELVRRQADLLGYDDHPYDALLDLYEPGLTVKQLDPIFAELKSFLTNFIAGRPQREKPPATKRRVSDSAQRKLVTQVLTLMGYDFESGRLDTSAHPFTDGLSPNDVRITTSFKSDNPFFSLESSIHEGGHALYEQGLPDTWAGTPLGEAASYAVHESQSRIWENQLSKSRAFTNYLWPLMQKAYGSALALRSADELYDWLNFIEPSLIRVEADEVTYNLHIILRYEIEKHLLDESLSVSELPETWNELMHEYLGVTVPNDSAGVLQDVHWSGGSVGYFPTYALGNLYAAQLFDAAHRANSQLDKQIAAGDLQPFLEFLRTNIHQYGRRYEPAELIERATDHQPSAKYFIDYIITKYKA